MNDLPSPLVAASVDLRAFDWFPFYHKRLRQSSFWKRASDLACRISVDFWAEAYEQVPAGSVPDDDYILAEWAGFGRRNVDGWLAVKDEVMSAWTRCSDGRWYHPTLCEVARKAWTERQLHHWEKECDRIRKANGRREKEGLEPLPFPHKPDERREGGASIPPEVPGDTPASSIGHPTDIPGIPAENALKGKETKKEDLSSSLRSEDCPPAAPADCAPESTAKKSRSPLKPRKHPYPEGAFGGWYRAYPRKKARQDAEKAFRKVEAADDTSFQTLLSGIDAFAKDNPDLAFWPYPASWLRGRRWLDEPSSSSSVATADGDRVSFGGGVNWPVSTVRKQVELYRVDPLSWPEHALGPPPDAPGCRVPERLLEAA